MIVLFDLCDCMNTQEQVTLLEGLHRQLLQKIKERGPLENHIAVWDGAHEPKPGERECSVRFRMWSDLLEKVPPWKGLRGAAIRIDTPQPSRSNHHEPLGRKI